MPRRVLSAISSALWPVILLTGCEGAPPATSRVPQTRPAERQPPASSQPVAGPASQPAGAPGVTAPPATQPPATQPAAQEPELPEYVTLVERFNPHQPVAARVRTEEPNRLVIETRNVRRLRIDRTRLPLDRRHSIALQLDGQGIEWLPKSEVVEFERSPNGDWGPFKPDRR